MIDLKYLSRKNNYRCCYCRDIFSLNELSREHFKPKSRGGLDKKNILLSCKDCNNKMKNLPEQIKIQKIINRNIRKNLKLYLF